MKRMHKISDCVIRWSDQSYANSCGIVNSLSTFEILLQTVFLTIAANVLCCLKRCDDINLHEQIDMIRERKTHPRAVITIFLNHSDPGVSPTKHN